MSSRAAARWLGPSWLAAALGLMSLVSVGCHTWAPLRIDPSGESIFLPATPPPGVSLPANACHTCAPAVSASVPQDHLTLDPREIIAPVGSEVVLQAGIQRASLVNAAGERIEWMLSPESAGNFVSVGEDDRCCLVRLAEGGPNAGKITNRFVIGTINRQGMRITRGTNTVADDVEIPALRSWVTLTSPTEGTSHVTAFAPSIAAWSLRKATSMVHWVDAQWVFPPPAINPTGSRHTFVTAVTRATDSTPIAGWLVRYEIIGGSPAGFAPDGAQVVEVPTDATGQAAAEIFQPQAQAGMSRIGIQIVRPAVPGSSQTKRLVLGTGTTTKTWTAPDLGLRTSGPAIAALGSTVTYTIEVTNPGDLPTREVTLTDPIPAGTSYQSSTPAATVQSGSLRWDLGTLGARETRRFEVNFQANQLGAINHCPEARSADGLTARHCAATTVGQPQLNVRIEGPGSAQVGSTVRYTVTVANVGDTVADGLMVRDTYDEGLQHLVAASPIERDLEAIPAGQSRQIYLTFRVLKPGRWCHKLDVLSGGQLRGTAQACLDASASPTTAPSVPSVEPNLTPPPTQPPIEQPAPSRKQPALQVTKTGPRQSQVGKTVEFFIVVKNTGEVPLTNLEIADNYELSLDPVNATDGFTVGREELIWKVARLEVGATHRLQVNCQCVTATPRACNRVTVRCDQVGPLADEACVEIAPPPEPPRQPSPAPSKLTLSIASLDEPVRMSGVSRYRISIENTGEKSDQNVQLTITFPPQLQPMLEGARGPVRATVDRQRIVFDQVAEIRAGETLKFEVQARAVRPGQLRVVGELTSDRLGRTLSQMEQTEVISDF